MIHIYISSTLLTSGILSLCLLVWTAPASAIFQMITTAFRPYSLSASFSFLVSFLMSSIGPERTVLPNVRSGSSSLALGISNSHQLNSWRGSFSIAASRAVLADSMIGSPGNRYLFLYHSCRDTLDSRKCLIWSKNWWKDS